MISLQTILESNHSFSSKFTSMVIQNMIREHTNIITNISTIFLKTDLKLTIPLIESIAIFSGLSLYDSYRGQVKI